MSFGEESGPSRCRDSTSASGGGRRRRRQHMTKRRSRQRKSTKRAGSVRRCTRLPPPGTVITHARALRPASALACPSPAPPPAAATCTRGRPGPAAAASRPGVAPAAWQTPATAQVRRSEQARRDGDTGASGGVPNQRRRAPTTRAAAAEDKGALLAWQGNGGALPCASGAPRAPHLAGRWWSPTPQAARAQTPRWRPAHAHHGRKSSPGALGTERGKRE